MLSSDTNMPLSEIQNMTLTERSIFIEEYNEAMKRSESK